MCVMLTAVWWLDVCYVDSCVILDVCYVDSCVVA